MVEYNSNILSVVTSREEAEAVIRDASKAYRAAEGAHGKATVKAAYATRVAVSHDILVVGKGAQRVKGITITATEYGARYQNHKGGGVAQSTVNLWVTLGFALVDCKVDEDSDLFRHLAFRGAGQKKSVADLIRGGATPEAIEEEVRKYVDPDGKKVTKAADQTEAGEGDGAPGGNMDGAQTSVALVKAALGTLATKVGDLSDDDWASVQEALGLARKALAARARAAKVSDAA